jgi:hydrogenase nickel incorporation protein HypB
MAVLRERVLKLNPGIRIFEVSCRTGEGLDAWARWLREQVKFERIEKLGPL